MRKRRTDKVKDPVCGMMVSADTHSIGYQHMQFAFCSVQCQERFIANPHLYIGVPGQQAPKQEGRELLRRRRIHVSEPLSADDAEAVVATVNEMMGIKTVSAEDNTIVVTYDLLQATAQQIERTITGVGLRLGDGWAERLRRAFVHDSEEWQISSLEVTPRKGCH